MSRGKIAFIDSGIGGLTVLHQALLLIPGENYIYYADTDNVPYGTKSKKEIRRLVFSATNKLSSYDLKALVIACNTATSVVVKKLREKYDFPIIGMEPAIKPALQISPEGGILLCATKRTIKEKKLKHLIKSLNAKSKIEALSLQKLVTFAEHRDFDSPKVEKYLRKKFAQLQWKDINVLVLGCTHFIFYKKLILKLAPKNISIVDGNLGTVQRLNSLIESQVAGQKEDTIWLDSGRIVESEDFNSTMKYMEDL